MPRLLDREARRDVAFEANRDHWLNELRILKAQRRTIAAGGSAIAAAGQIEGYVNPPPVIGKHLAPVCLEYSEYRYKAWQSMAAVELPGSVQFCTGWPTS